TAPVTLASAAVILFVPPRTGAGSSWRVAVAILVGGLVTWLATGRANTGTVAVLEELGGVGLVLALLGLLAGRRGIADGYWTIAAVGAGVWGLASALGPVARVAPPRHSSGRWWRAGSSRWPPGAAHG